MKLMRAPNLITGQHWVNVLETAGIACELHNRYLNGALGDIPADQCAPELWLVDERDEAMARRLIDAASHGPAADSPGWRCRQCGELLEAQFTVCWQCGTARDPLDG
ncbi:putative signal transducing protein [Paraburkholderia sp. RAU2J]|uniref:putative signal transducing protein n=1 Tax=Paraburkholderia sp. RAU2J TaxID=1938810 RepID=UPI000EAF0116|nr:DUF2007 domain-containing protein [Paraburkholderia sp. RAU2J]RKT24658.1 putative signal transducing protein [Paraburkholderia sp. RAU2J]